MAKVKTIPDGYPRVTPYLHVDGASAAIEFYSRVFGATERMRMPAPGGKVGHAELQIGDSLIMLADEFPDSSTATDLGNSRIRSAIAGTSPRTSRTSLPTSWRNERPR